MANSNPANRAVTDALGALHASGGDVLEWAVDTAQRVASGEIDADTAIEEGFAAMDREDTEPHERPRGA